MSCTRSRYELNIIVIMCLEVTYNNIVSVCIYTQRIGVGVERIKIISLTTNYLYVNLFKFVYTQTFYLPLYYVCL